MKVVINRCFGGFGLSDAAYEKLIEWGVPVRKYVQETRDPVTNLYVRQPGNEGEVIFDNELTPPGESDIVDIYWKYKGKVASRRYWQTWLDSARTHPLLIRVVEELGEAADGPHAQLAIVEVPDGAEWHIHDYDGREHVAENHRTWD